MHYSVRALRGGSWWPTVVYKHFFHRVRVHGNGLIDGMVFTLTENVCEPSCVVEMGLKGRPTFLYPVTKANSLPAHTI